MLFCWQNGAILTISKYSIMTSQMQKIFVIEDEAGIADTIQYVLESDGFTPVWCTTAQEALERFEQEKPLMAILDIGLPDMHGFELFRRLQKLPSGSHTPMLFLTARSEEIDRVAGLELGADDYIAKPFSPRELVARVRTILRRFEKTQSLSTTRATVPTEKPFNQQNPFTHDESRRKVTFYSHALDLSRYEYRLLCLLIQRPGRVFTREELLQIVWDQGNDSFDRTVDAHIKTLRAKLRTIAPDIDAIKTVRGVGYALNEVWPTKNSPA